LEGDAAAGAGIERAGPGIRECGSPIMTELDVTPELDWIKSGTLDDTWRLRPELAIRGHDGQAWLSLPPGVQQVDRNPSEA
jgi:hypothetical protein